MKKVSKQILIFLILGASLLSLCGCQANHDQIISVEGLGKKKIAVLQDSGADEYVLNCRNINQPKIKYAISNTDLVALLVSGKVDASVVDYLSAQNLLKKNTNLIQLPGMLNSSKYAIAAPKGSNLIDEFNRVIVNMKKNGSMDDLIKKWTDDQPEITFEQYWAGTNGTIRCVVAADNEPLCYKDAFGSLTGFDIELIYRLAKEANYKIELYTLPSEDIIPALMSNQYDCAIGGLIITNARTQMVDFTKGYLDAGLAILVRDEAAISSSNSIWAQISNSFRKTFIEDSNWKSLLDGFKVTITFCVITFICSVILAIILFIIVYAGCKPLEKFLSWITVSLNYLPMPTVVLFVFYVFFSGEGVNGLTAGIIAFIILTGIPMYNDLMRGIESIDQGQKDAAKAMGYSKFKALRKIYLPQAFFGIMISMKIETNVLIKCSTLLCFVAVQDFQTAGTNVMNNTFELFLPIFFNAVAYALLIFISVKLLDLVRLPESAGDLTEEQIKAKFGKE